MVTTFVPSVVRSRAQVHSGIQPRVVPLPEDDDGDDGESDDSDKKSKMSFSYWGADKVTIQKPVVRPRHPGAHGGRRGMSGGSSYARESSANAKFGTRLVSGESPNSNRPASRRTQGTPASRRPPPLDDAQSAKATVTRPAWDSSPRSPPAATAPAKRVRNVSLTNTSTRTPVNKEFASPAPSEDSGVGMYRQMMAQDPSLNR